MLSFVYLYLYNLSCANLHNPKLKHILFSLFVGTLVGVSVYGIHRNATVWENPDVSQGVILSKSLCSESSQVYIIEVGRKPRKTVEC